jgi:primosomal replication protein N
MKKGKVEKFSILTIAETVKREGWRAANERLSFAIGSRLDISGTVQKVVKRDGQCKLVIEPGDVPGFVVFADCLSDAETVRNSKIRKGSSVRVKGKLQRFGARAACLSDCRLQGKK